MNGRAPIGSHWTLIRKLTAVIFLAHGGAKILGFPSHADSVVAILGLPLIMASLIGLVEVLGGLALAFERSAFYAAVLLALVSGLATLSHLALLSVNPAFPLTMLLICVGIAHHLGTTSSRLTTEIR